MSSRGPSSRGSWRVVLGWASVATLFGAGVGEGCARSIEVATLGEQGATSADAGCVVRTCEGRVFDCGDCQDNDADGLVDDRDPACWGVCHDSEESWAPLQRCSNQSCFFDHDCGLGNDDECVNWVPNGCDCHGCCEVSARAGAVFIGTVDADENPTCGADSVSDPVACASCVVDEQCFNPCASGEVCF